MSCWEILDLPYDADTRSIKRQYAVLLKLHRPDEDPEGFQRLREAYEQALDRASRLTERGEALTHTTATRLKQPEVERHKPQVQLASKLLQGITNTTVEQRFAQARNLDCADAFEDQLLQRCLEPSEQTQALIEWGLEQFNWLTPWQRANLASDALEQLLKRLAWYTEHSLGELLTEGNDAQFCQHVYVLKLLDWLQPLDRRTWFNAMLARVLLVSEYWSTEVFNAICKLQGWKDDGTFDPPCPQPQWSQLLKRHLEQVFFEEQQRLAAQACQTPRTRAARLLLTPMSAQQREQFTRFFLKDDWVACQDLSNTLRHQYPQLYGKIPGAMPQIWGELKRRYGPGLLSYVQLEKLKSLGLLLVIICAMVIPAVYFNGHLVGKNQGLQPLPERVCSRQSAPPEQCRLPATDAQWYPSPKSQESVQ